MENPHLEHVPPDRRENFLENGRTVTAPIEFDSKHSIGSGKSFEGVDLPRKTNGPRIKEERLVKEILSNSLKFSKKKGVKSGTKEVGFVIDLVESGHGNKIGKLSEVTGIRPDSFVISILKVNLPLQSEIDDHMVDNMDASGMNLNENPDVNQSTDIPMIPGNRSVNSNVVNGCSSENQPIPESVQISVDVPMSISPEDNQNVTANVKSGIDSEVLLNSVNGDMNSHVDSYNGQRPKSDLETAIDSNNENFIKSVMDSVGTFTFGRGGGFTSKGGGTGSAFGTNGELCVGLQVNDLQSTKENEDVTFDLG
ncbi:hypothetical protein L6452_40481 [Arctium lappa]|uniref:Uncharacterized protein n=1 Tax=Arctium lappa TaxID=4217 RepID=A0ACB8XM04_ARCLA|nr:hypothetical protein L6452_40481 [Arctium lappa]